MQDPKGVIGFNDLEKGDEEFDRGERSLTATGFCEQLMRGM